MKLPVVKLSDIAAIPMGQSPPGSSYNQTGNGIPLFQGKAEFGETHPFPVKWCTQPTRVAEAGDILLSVRAPVGPTNIANQRCCIGRGLAAIQAKAQLTEQKYLYFFFKYIEPSLSRQGQGSTFPAINRSEIESILVTLPSISEQRRIIEILDQADALRRKRAEADAKAERILPALFIKIFGDPVTNPLGWKILELGQVSKRITDGTHQPPQFVHEGVPFLFVQNIVNGYIDFNTQKYITEDTYAELTKRVRPERNDILYSTVGSYGVAVRVDTDRKFSFQRHIGIIKLDHSQIDPWFLCAQLNMPHVKAQADQRVRGIAQKTLNLSELKQFCILVPPLAKQKQFTQLMTVTSNMLQAAQRQSHLLNSSFDVLLQRAFSGNLTTKWREAHLTELSVEIEQQAKILRTTADSDYEQLSLTKMQ